MKSRASVAVVLAAGLCASACVQLQNSATNEKPIVAEKPFAAGGKIVMHLDGGAYEIRPAADRIAVGDPDDYSSVDASVKAGDTEAGVFGGSRSGLLQHFTWSGHGKYTLRANLGAGNLVLRGK